MFGPGGHDARLPLGWVSILGNSESDLMSFSVSGVPLLSPVPEPASIGVLA